MRTMTSKEDSIETGSNYLVQNDKEVGDRSIKQEETVTSATTTESTTVESNEITIGAWTEKQKWYTTEIWKQDDWINVCKVVTHQKNDQISTATPINRSNRRSRYFYMQILRVGLRHEELRLKCEEKKLSQKQMKTWILKCRMNKCWMIKWKNLCQNTKVQTRMKINPINMRKDESKKKWTKFQKNRISKEEERIVTNERRYNKRNETKEDRTLRNYLNQKELYSINKKNEEKRKWISNYSRRTQRSQIIQSKSQK